MGRRDRRLALVTHFIGAVCHVLRASQLGLLLVAMCHVIGRGSSRRGCYSASESRYDPGSDAALVASHGVNVPRNHLAGAREHCRAIVQCNPCTDSHYCAWWRIGFIMRFCNELVSDESANS